MLNSHISRNTKGINLEGNIQTENFLIDKKSYRADIFYFLQTNSDVYKTKLLNEKLNSKEHYSFFLYSFNLSGKQRQFRHYLIHLFSNSIEFISIIGILNGFIDELSNAYHVFFFQTTCGDSSSTYSYT